MTLSSSRRSSCPKNFKRYGLRSLITSTLSSICLSLPNASCLHWMVLHRGARWTNRDREGSAVLRIIRSFWSNYTAILIWLIVRRTSRITPSPLVLSLWLNWTRCFISSCWRRSRRTITGRDCLLSSLVLIPQERESIRSCSTSGPINANFIQTILIASTGLTLIWSCWALLFPWRMHALSERSTSMLLKKCKSSTQGRRRRLTSSWSIFPS